MAQPIIENRVVPFTEHVNGMFPGRTFTIVGTVMPNANRFYINLQPHEGSDIVMHFNPRFDQNKIVLNNREGGVWKNEEIHSLGSSFVQGKLFKLIIFCWENNMEFVLDGKDLLSIKNRVPLYSISRINVEGDVVINSLDFSISGRYPDKGIEVLNPTANKGQAAYRISYGPSGLMGCSKTVRFNPTQHNAVDSIYLKVVNRSVPIPFDDITYHTIVILGQPANHISDRFSINLECENKDIAMHINPRSNDKVIVRNTRVNGVWKAEERDLPIEYPFATNSPFEMMIRSCKTGFGIYLNGVLLFKYYPPSRGIELAWIRSLMYEGGVTVNNISFY